MDYVIFAALLLLTAAVCGLGFMVYALHQALTLPEEGETIGRLEQFKRLQKVDGRALLRQRLIEKGIKFPKPKKVAQK
jgi:hypothetical protein